MGIMDGSSVPISGVGGARLRISDLGIPGWLS